MSKHAIFQFIYFNSPGDGMNFLRRAFLGWAHYKDSVSTDNYKPFLLCSFIQQTYMKNPPYVMHWGCHSEEKKLGFLEAGTNYFTKAEIF